MIVIPPINPIKFKGDVGAYDFGHSEKLCYLQPFEIGDSTKLQVLSDEAAPTLTVRDMRTGFVVWSSPFDEIPTLISGVDFKCCEIEILFATLGIGDYVLDINGVSSMPISVRDSHPNTIMIRYANTENDFSVLFDTGIIFHIRVQGTIQDFSPMSDDEIYNDQKRNATKLYSLPYRVFTLYIGNAAGIPDWMQDKVNRAWSCDMIQVDGDWFEKTEGAEWEVARSDLYPFAGLTLEIMPSFNNLLERLKFEEGSDITPEENMIIQRFRNQYLEASEDISIAGTFQQHVVLDYISIYRRGVDFTLNVGTTNGGTEIGTFLIDDQLKILTIRHRFMTPQTVYLTGITGSNDIVIVWDKTDRLFNAADAGGDPTPQPSDIIGGNATVMYQGSMLELEEDFNIVTGVGRNGTDWAGWVISDGQNGTFNAGGRTVVFWDKDHPQYGVIGAQGGASSVTLTKTNLPNITLEAKIPLSSISKGEAGYGKFVSGGQDADGQILPTIVTDPLGDGTPISVVQDYIVFVLVKKLRQ